MRVIELAVKEVEARIRESVMYEIIGKFGDRLPNDVQDEIREEAKLEASTRLKLNKRIERLVQ